MRVLGGVVERLGWENRRGDVGGGDEDLLYDVEQIRMCVRRMRLWRCLLRMEEY